MAEEIYKGTLYAAQGDGFAFALDSETIIYSRPEIYEIYLLS